MVLLTSTNEARAVSHGDEVFEPLEGTDDVFELPAELAEHLLAVGGWRHTEADELPDVDDQVDDTETPDDDVVDEAPAPAPRPRKRAPRKTAS